MASLAYSSLGNWDSSLALASKIDLPSTVFVIDAFGFGFSNYLKNSF